MIDGLDNEMKLAKKYGVNLAFGTDAAGSDEMFGAQISEFSTRLKWLSEQARSD